MAIADLVPNFLVDVAENVGGASLPLEANASYMGES